MSEPLAASYQMSMFSAVDFPVSHIRLLADVVERPTSATCGPHTPVSFASYDRGGWWRKTCQGFSQVTLDGSLERFSETWPRAGMTRNGIAYLRQPSVPLTDATGCGWWPTPSASDGMGGRMPAADAHLRRKVQIGLNYAVKMWPTPVARDHKGQGMSRARRLIRPPDNLCSAVKLETGSGSLNPTWVEWLMGYPTEWTVLKAWGTRSSRKSPNGLRGASSKQSTTGT